MKFKNWMMSELNKGLKRQFQQQNSHVPNYVAKDIFHQRLGNMWRGSQGALSGSNSTHSNQLASTLAMPNPQKNQYSSVSDMMNDPKITSVTNAQWDKKPRVIEVSPMSFDENSLQKFMVLSFGTKYLSDSDAVRNNRANELMKTHGEKNEPIIVLQIGQNKYKLVEGFHRTMQYLLSGAPERDQIGLQNRTIAANELNLSAWKAVRINAYVGYPQVNSEPAA